MHKNIAKLIQKMVVESPYHGHLFSCDVIPNENSDGFWKCTIHFKDMHNAHSASLCESLHYIGMVYGEGLSIIREGNIVEVR